MEILKEVSSVKKAAIKLNCGRATIYNKLLSPTYAGAEQVEFPQICVFSTYPPGAGAERTLSIVDKVKSPTPHAQGQNGR